MILVNGICAVSFTSFTQLWIRSLKQAHAVGLAWHKGGANIAHVLSFSGKLVACFNGCFLGGGELVHLDSW
jgi:hypothetical protein